MNKVDQIYSNNITMVMIRSIQAYRHQCNNNSHFNTWQQHQQIPSSQQQQDYDDNDSYDLGDADVSTPIQQQENQQQNVKLKKKPKFA